MYGLVSPFLLKILPRLVSFLRERQPSYCPYFLKESPLSLRVYGVKPQFGSH